MKIGIHHRPGSFSDTWIKYCQEHGISYELVDVYRNDILERLPGNVIFLCGILPTMITGIC